MENVHSEMCSLLLDTYVKDSAQKVHLFHAIDNIPFIVPETHPFYSFQIAMENVHSEMYNLLLDTYFPQIWELYKKAEALFWTMEKVDLSRNLSRWNSLTNGERYFITHVIVVFLPSETALSLKILLVSEACAFYSFQIAMENVHSEMYSLLLDTYVKDSAQKVHLFRVIDNIPFIAIFKKDSMRSFKAEASFRMTGGGPLSGPLPMELSHRCFFAIGDGIILENLVSRFMNKVKSTLRCTASYFIPTSKTLLKRSTSFAPLITSLLSPSLKKLLYDLLAIKPRSIGRGPKRGPPPCQASFWTTGEVDLSRDLSQWKSLTDGEGYFITHVIIVFLPSETALSLKILLYRFLKPRAFYSFQIAMENVHSEMYNLVLGTYVKDSTEKVHLFHAIDNIPFISIFRKDFVPSVDDKTSFHWERSRVRFTSSLSKMKPIYNTHYLPSTFLTDMITLQEGRDFILDDGGGGPLSGPLPMELSHGWGAIFHNSCDCNFFAIGDGIIHEILLVLEYRAFYSFQIGMENVHSDCTSFCLIPMSKTLHKKVLLFRAIGNIPFIAIFRKAYMPSFGDYPSLSYSFSSP
ncbi:putative ribonucleoside-diphosphate reductase small chain B, partial [Mucuna pruriens]